MRKDAVDERADTLAERIGAPVGGDLPIVARLKIAARRYAAEADARAAIQGGNESGADTLGALLMGAEGGESPGVLAARLGVTTATMTNRLDRLEAQRLVERGPAPNDRRSLVITLTPEGRGRAEHAARASLEAARDFLSPLSEPERMTLDALLRRLIEAS